MALSEVNIKNYIRRREYENRLIITPLLSEDQIGPTSIDVRLGSSIIVPKRTYSESQDVTDPKIIRQVESRRYDKIRLQYGSKFPFISFEFT